ncbi:MULTISPECIES: hypothetical protein [unclassified Pseudoalteromonas]|jgi:hypothetical protein|uniref:hypothetical protein n=1 Tax=unclassified Pseudoalteromonas TaxID=194690 RepID=UPI00110A6FD6|nr:MULTISPECIES: hypothetical protein [unclassified Pseudoalteromonas]MDC9522287.1 hypothetical protein [Pseudoalteromonas sp. Angola-31]MDC9503522.1 hypothetical protein [Pseudoalteromonas sp. Angola-18]MDC9531619.1 hypothetical protein [Pseudoalteromonas sp. Angola-7]TMO03442.1 hypothetical protein CWB60_19215 [Pseudoalteromonas sp. S327]TMO19196.1 hypothetical protein CWB59_06380 [Pseudoalteromonas sp. S326]
MPKDTIYRGASDKTKGFRLQKIRAIKLMIEEIIKNDRQLFYTAIEITEDVDHTIVNESHNESRVEELKAYDNSAFTLQSEAVKNTLVSFFDIYFKNWQSSDNVKLGFYTTATIGKEKKKVLFNGTNLAPPAQPILKIFSDGGPLDQSTFEYFKATILEEYRSQYFKTPNPKSANYAQELARQQNKLDNSYFPILKNLTLEEANNFLDKIYWHFDDEDNDALKASVLQLIKTCPLSNLSNEDKEETIFCELMELLDERQNDNVFSNKFITGSDVKMVFKNAESSISVELLDPSWERYHEESQRITDKRNLGDKLMSVCPDFSKQLHGIYSREACTVKIDTNSGKSFLALKYRVFLACAEYLALNAQSTYTQDEIITAIGNMLEKSTATIEALKNDFTYRVSNEVIIKSIIYDLFDECFIALNEV